MQQDLITQTDDVMLTTTDNPYSPFDDFVRWWKEDLVLGHDTCGTLASRTMTSDVASDEINEKEVDRVMDEMVKEFPLIYRKVRREDYKY